MSKTLIVVTGPSGAGKSAFCKRQEDWTHALFNLDDWAAKEGDVQNPSVRERAWGKMKLAALRAMKNNHPLVVLDHVCDSEAVSDIIGPAKHLGYRISLWVVSPGSVNICMRRVEERKRQGGHGMTGGSAIEEIYDSALSVASALAIMSSETHFIDSATEDFSLIGSIRNYKFEAGASQTPDWVRRYFTTESD